MIARPSLMLVELNEFSIDLFRQAADEITLPNIERLLAMPRSRTVTDDGREHHGLDPWVQWVSVHTGQPSGDHGVLHLGDTPGKLGALQIWELLGEHGIRSGIWGAMNATRGNSTLCDFFLPDPWTFTEPAYPPPLNDLLSLPRYYARNYLDVSVLEFCKGCLRMARYLPRSGGMGKLLRVLPLMLSGVARNGVDNRVLFSLFDLVSTALFVGMRRRYPVQFSLIFLNSIAHLQHHRWRVDEGLPSDVRFAMRAIDRVLGMLFADRRPGEALLVMNALSQRNVGRDEALVAYRQIKPAAFLDAAGFTGHRVEQLMTSDAHVFFPSRAQRDQAVSSLRAARVHGKLVFEAEADPAVEGKLFYQVTLWDPVPAGAMLEVNERNLPFERYFAVLAHRTGAHLPEGDAFAQGMELPATIYNHGVRDRILDYLQARP